MRLIDMDNLIRYANNQRDKTVDANDIARMPRIEAVPIKPLAKWLAGYAFPPGLKAREIVNNRGRDIHEIAVEGWEAFLREMDWEEDE